MADVNWLSIKNEYITTDISYRKLAGKHNVSFATLQHRARKEGWKAERDKQCDRVETRLRQKTADVIIKKEVDRVTRISNAADALLDKLEQAIDQIDNYIVTNKRKVKTVEYDNKIGKPSKEVTTETENLQIVDGVIDRQGLKQLASALKDLKDVQLVVSAAAVDESEDDGFLDAMAGEADKIWQE